jgi:Tol biopolymer transport system component
MCSVTTHKMLRVGPVSRIAAVGPQTAAESAPTPSPEPPPLPVVAPIDASTRLPVTLCERTLYTPFKRGALRSRDVLPEVPQPHRVVRGASGGTLVVTLPIATRHSIRRPPPNRCIFQRFREIVSMSRLRLVPTVVALALHSAALAAQQVPALRTLASFQGDSIQDLSTSPNGRFVVLGTRTSLWMYDVASRQSWSLADGGGSELNWSPRGDRIAYVRASDADTGQYVWTMRLDANTGRARGPAQRVTTGQGDGPSVSPDGRFIAFASYDSGQAERLTVVPVTGGPERVLAPPFPRGLEGIYWSADGRSIYFNADAPGSTVHSVLKATIGRRALVTIRSHNEWIAGMTEDRRYLVLVPVEPRVAPGDRATVIDTAGREVGHVLLPAGTGVVYDGVLGDSDLIWVAARDQRVLEVRPVAGGCAKRLPVIGESDDIPIWSPDGTRIAFQVRDGVRTSLALVNADGTNPRVYPEAEVLRPDAWSASWSPDSRFVAIRGPGRLASARRLSLLDVDAGTIHTILEDTGHGIGIWQWRADGRAIVLALVDRGNWARGRIEEVTESGQRRELLPLNNINGFAFVGGASAFMRMDSTAILRPLNGGPVNRLSRVPSGTSLNNVVASNDLRRIAGLLVDPKRHTIDQVEVFSVETGARTVLDLPFGLYPPGDRPAFLPGDSALLVFGQYRAGTDVNLFRVPLNGDTPSVFADVGKPQSDSYISAASVSPDGRTVVYAVQPEFGTQSLELIDLRSAIPRSTSRTPRR